MIIQKTANKGYKTRASRQTTQHLVFLLEIAQFNPCLTQPWTSCQRKFCVHIMQKLHTITHN